MEFSPGKSLGIIVKLPGLRKFSVIPAEVIWANALDGSGGEYQYQIGIKYLYLLPDLADNFRELFRILK